VFLEIAKSSSRITPIWSNAEDLRRWRAPRAFAENKFPRVKGAKRDAGIIASIKRPSPLLQVRARIVPSDALRYFQSPIVVGPLSWSSSLTRAGAREMNE
jgi:hypothetical protein